MAAIITSDPPEPAVRLREELARRRARGETFEEAWPASLAAATEGLSHWRAAEWSYLLREIRPGWAAAYDRRPHDGAVVAALRTLD